MAGAHPNGGTNDWLVSEVDTATVAKAAAAAAKDRMAGGGEGGVDESTQLDQVRERLKAVNDLSRE